jgi:glycosyltransferase involved in cell wall biosynthesis
VLHHAGKLGHVYTDFWASAPWRLLGKLAGKSSLATRCHPDLPRVSVTSFNLHTLKAYRQRFSNPYDGFLQVGKAFGQQVVSDLVKSEKWKVKSGNPTNSQLPASSSTVFFGYDTGFLEPAQWIKARGGKSIVCQMDPSRYEVDLVKAEEKRWPGWARHSVEVPDAYFKRREDEWATADLVMVNSEWTRQALIKQGVSEAKIVVVPLAFEASSPRLNSVTHSQPSTFDAPRPLRVLFLGQVILRKGIQYLVESARLLEKESIHFDIVGSIGISDAAVASAPANMSFHGPVNRDRTKEFYRSADLFVLPTLSDGFALTQLEAMAYGLPVIATPNCGDVVTDGTDGLIIPASDANALAESFQLILQDPGKLRAMSDATRGKVEKFTLSKLGENLAVLEHRLFRDKIKDPWENCLSEFPFSQSPTQ